jgi:hypothetical protein
VRLDVGHKRMNIQQYQNMVDTARENLETHRDNAPVDLSVSSPEWREWIAKFKVLSQKWADAQIGLIRFAAMENQGVNDGRFK